LNAVTTTVTASPVQTVKAPGSAGLHRTRLVTG
jgi:hypothetical protein